MSDLDKPGSISRPQKLQTDLDRERASRVLSTLLGIGRPVFAGELASMCESFGVTTELVRCLCSVPNSPIFMSENGLVSVSMGSGFGTKIGESKRVWSLDLKTYFRKRKRKGFGSAVLSLTAKRNLILPSEFVASERDQSMLTFPTRVEDNSPEGDSSKGIASASSFLESNAHSPKLSVIEFDGDEDDDDDVRMDVVCPPKSFGLDCALHSLVVRGTDYGLSKSIRVEEPNASPVKACFGDSHSCASLLGYAVEDVAYQELIRRKGRDDNYAAKECSKLSIASDNLGISRGTLSNCFESRSTVNSITLNKVKGTCKAETETKLQSQASKFLCKSKGTHKNPPPKRVLTELNIPLKSGQKFRSLEHNAEGIAKHNVDGKENTLSATIVSSNKQVERKELPHFDNFIIEDEEGSGGYGTVYRACRKSDGKKCAIKCPHARVHKNHVNNEVKMLERFGGRNFIVKYEGSVKNGDTECLILEHVDHDQPEVLKKEIDIYQLRWYGYCLFRALAFLHKEGVMHRDVKPGNFLFSRRQSKGVLVDFNLSMDLQQKYADGSKPKSSCLASISHDPPSHPKSSRSAKDKVVSGVHSAFNLVETTPKKKPFQETNTKMRIDSSTSLLPSGIAAISQRKGRGADASGLNSIKDATSTRAISAERMKEPLPSLGRKELISLVQDVMHSPNHDALKTHVPQRKRIASPPGKILYTSPMPLYSNGIPVAGTGFLRFKGDVKQKRDGPCFGTKGYRAPEVLFRSLHQGPKLDVWSAGVTMLYLMIGRSPFTGEPEQNVKEIAKLRGSEELWEVAKLHDRESSFPMELLDVRALPSVELRSWCKTRMRRPEFLGHIPSSLFDLIDKCLAVNPRLRISAEEALHHDFFAPCHESMKKRRMREHEINANKKVL